MRYIFFVLLSLNAGGLVGKYTQVQLDFIAQQGIRRVCTRFMQAYYDNDQIRIQQLAALLQDKFPEEYQKEQKCQGQHEPYARLVVRILDNGKNKG